MGWVVKLTRSFGHAGRGLLLAAHDRNQRIMLVGGVVVVALASAYDVSRTSWALLVVCIGAVLGAEGINTAIERLADHVESEHHSTIRDIKDLAAGAVLAICVSAGIVGAIVFWPYITT